MFISRLISGIVLLAVMIPLFLFGGTPLCLAIMLVAIVGYLELCKALNSEKVITDGVTLGQYFKRLKPDMPELIGVIGTVLLYLNILFGLNTAGLFAIVIFTMGMLLFLYVFAFPKYEAEKIMISVFSFIYAPCMLAAICLTRASEPYGKYLIWVIIIGSWGCDTCAYCVGKLIGKHKAFPVLSPHKSIEGCVGGVIGCALLGALYGFIFVAPNAENNMIVLELAVVCAICGLMSMVGDLAASAVKRNKGIKDYGRLIPGHGGIMDRFDSMIVTAQVAFIASLILR